mmetsp:Transcript_18597/g.42515  ORF Transcript_18597/g.42515 Transcript_18597/m.42515 type:complete len:85 (-) Transcript_18597:154-408(-)
MQHFPMIFGCIELFFPNPPFSILTSLWYDLMLTFSYFSSSNIYSSISLIMPSIDLVHISLSLNFYYCFNFMLTLPIILLPFWLF